MVPGAASRWTSSRRDDVSDATPKRRLQQYRSMPEVASHRRDVCSTRLRLLPQDLLCPIPLVLVQLEPLSVRNGGRVLRIGFTARSPLDRLGHGGLGRLDRSQSTDTRRIVFAEVRVLRSTAVMPMAFRGHGQRLHRRGALSTGCLCAHAWSAAGIAECKSCSVLAVRSRRSDIAMPCAERANVGADRASRRLWVRRADHGQPKTDADRCCDLPADRSLIAWTDVTRAMPSVREYADQHRYRSNGGQHRLWRRDRRAIRLAEWLQASPMMSTSHPQLHRRLQPRPGSTSCLRSVE